MMSYEERKTEAKRQEKSAGFGICSGRKWDHWVGTRIRMIAL